MEFEHFALARDFFYLAALFFGAGLGCILSRFRRRSTTRFRDMTVTVGLCFFSGSLAVLTLAIIYSNWMIFKETRFFLPVGILVALSALAFRFPRATGFPLVFISGVFVVWMGYAYLRLPVIDGSSSWGELTRDGNGLVHVRLVSPESDTFLSCQPETESLEFRAFSFFFPGTFPLVGGAKRGIIREILGNSESLYVDPLFDRVFSPGQYPWPGANDKLKEAWERIFSFHETQERLETKAIPPGIGLKIFFEGSFLEFR